MRYGIFSDIHSNLEAFEAVLEALRSENVDQLFCVGDIVGYGANPKECLEIIKRKNVISVAGNHDRAVCGRIDYSYFNDYGKKAVEWTRRQINFEDQQFLGRLPEVYKTEQLTLVHGTLNSPEEFYYCIDTEDSQGTFFEMTTPICFIGHTHVPLIFSRKGQAVSYTNSFELTLEADTKYIVNVGSVGQPRDGNPKASYAVFDDKARTVSIKRVSYDVKSAQAKILEAGLPEFLAVRLAVGQ